jgi:hypothetical protein
MPSGTTSIGIPGKGKLAEFSSASDPSLLYENS